MASRRGVYPRLLVVDRHRLGAIVLYVAAVAILVAEARAPGQVPNAQTQDAAAFALLGLASAALLLRRRWPVVVSLAVTSCALLGFDRSHTILTHR